MNHPWGKEIEVCSNKVPRVMYVCFHPRDLNFYIVIYREMLKTNLLLKNCFTNSDNM